MSILMNPSPSEERTLQEIPSVFKSLPPKKDKQPIAKSQRLISRGRRLAWEISASKENLQQGGSVRFLDVAELEKSEEIDGFRFELYDCYPSDEYRRDEEEETMARNRALLVDRRRQIDDDDDDDDEEEEERRLIERLEQQQYELRRRQEEMSALDRLEMLYPEAWNTPPVSQRNRDAGTQTAVLPERREEQLIERVEGRVRHVERVSEEEEVRAFEDDDDDYDFVDEYKASRRCDWETESPPSSPLL